MKSSSGWPTSFGRSARPTDLDGPVSGKWSCMVEEPRFEERTARFLRPWALRWDYPVNPETFFTPLRECIALKTGRPIDAAALDKLKQHGLAHALVVEPMEHEQWPNINIAALGIVSVARAEQMQREGVNGGREPRFSDEVDRLVIIRPEGTPRAAIGGPNPLADAWCPPTTPRLLTRQISAVLHRR